MAGAVRINKYIADAGLCSRREADKLIRSGRVLVDGRIVEPGTRVTDDMVVTLDGEPLHREADGGVVLILNKPRGIVCTAEKREPDNIIDYIGYPKRLFTVGRLDKDSRGLVILTNIGQLAHVLTKAKFGHEKEYLVTVDHPITDDFIRQMSEGVYLEVLDKTTAPCRVKKVSPTRFSIILTQGLNRQIRRMCGALDYHVRDLCRVRELYFTLEDIPEGEYRKLTEKEILTLKEKLGI